MKITRLLAGALALSVALAGCGGETKKEEAPKTNETTTTAPAKTVELQFYFPVAVGGAVTKNIEDMVSEFNTKNPSIKVTPVFAGDYTQTMTKVQAAAAGGTPADVTVLLATDVFTLKTQNAIVPLDDLVAKDKDGAAWLADFTPAFMGNSKLDGKTWSVPFQRSTVVMYYNKDLFKAAGIANPPKTWDELVDAGKKLTKDGVWGLEIPSDGNPSWVFSSFFIQNGKNVVNEAGNEVSFNAPEVVEALTFIQALGKTHKIMPEGVTAWANVPNDFINGKAAMIFHTTGSIGNIKSKMDVAKIGVAALPGKKRQGSPTGGGNLYIMKTTPEKQEAAYKFVKFMTEPDRVAAWSAATGYIPATKKATEAKAWKDAVAAFPGFADAVGAMQFADREIATYQNQQVLKALGDQLQAVVTGSKSAKDALEQAQKDATAILAPFKK